MNSGKKPDSLHTESTEPDAEGSRAAGEDWVPLSVRNARKIRKDVWPHLWMSFASVILLAAALAILAYRMGAQSCH
jgi:hypothetical protein